MIESFGEGEYLIERLAVTPVTAACGVVPVHMRETYTKADQSLEHYKMPSGYAQENMPFVLPKDLVIIGPCELYMYCWNPAAGDYVTSQMIYRRIDM